jgi:glycine/D-amino acid oxidase-like deaminating enzyme
MNNYKKASFWFDSFFDNPDTQHIPREALLTEIEADVVIIGAGYTGLWSAYYLKSLKPELDVVILEAEIAGFGASGRNGGWVAGSISGLARFVEPLVQQEKQKVCSVLFENVDHIGVTLAKENIDASFNKSGVIYAAARYPEQLKQQQSALQALYATGHSDDDCYWMDKTALEQKLKVRNGLGGIYNRHCATINPARMVRGLADVVEKMGVKIYEKTTALSIKPRKVMTEKGGVTATTIIPALEGYSANLQGFGQYMIPVHSLIIATEPLNNAVWDEIGLSNREAFSDASRMVTYGHRSSDNRMIFGSRGGYNYGGKARSDFSLEDVEFRSREALLHDLFPVLKNVNTTHGWGGSLGIARRFSPHVIYNSQTGIATAGGYGGQGVAASHLFARTLVDLILNRESELCQMPWVFNQSSHQRVLRKWEPEPVRWLVSKAISSAFAWEENLYLNKSGTDIRKPLANKISNALSMLMH